MGITYEEEITRLSGRVARLEDDKRLLETALTERDGRIARLKDDKHFAEEEAARVGRQNADLEFRIGELTDGNATLSWEVLKLRSELHAVKEDLRTAKLTVKEMLGSVTKGVRRERKVARVRGGGTARARTFEEGRRAQSSLPRSLRARGHGRSRPWQRHSRASSPRMPSASALQTSPTGRLGSGSTPSPRWRVCGCQACRHPCCGVTAPLLLATRPASGDRCWRCSPPCSWLLWNHLM